MRNCIRQPFHLLSFWAVIQLITLPTLLPAQETLQDLMLDRSKSISEVKEAAEIYFQNKGKGEGSGWNEYQRWLNWNEPRYAPSGDRSQVSPAILKTEFEKFQSLYTSHRKTQAAGPYWSELGPSYATNFLPSGYANGVGRVEAVWADPQNGDTLFLGARGGGFWRSFDGGANWESTTQDLPGVGVWDIAVKPDQHNVVYIITRHGTGYSLGILKSTDWGGTWSNTGLNIPLTNYETLKKIRIPDTAPDSLYVSSDKGFYRSGNGGATWTTLLTSNVRDFAIRPGTSNEIYLILTSNNDAIKISTDGGSTWPQTTNISGNSNAGSRLAVCAAFPTQVFFQSGNGIWASTNSGTSFTLRGTPPENMAFGVSDQNPDIMVIGGLDQHLSTDGGVTFSLVCPWANPSAANFVHADGRTVRSWNGVLYLGTDGYLAKSTDDGATWSILNLTGTPIREFYRIGMTPLHDDMIIGGSQDNGTSIRIEGTWYEWYGADGMNCFIDRNNTRNWLGSVQNGGYMLSTQNGQNHMGISPLPSNGAWVSPLIADPSNDNTIFCAYDSVFKSYDNGQNWEFLADFATIGNMNEMAISKVDSNLLYITRDARIWRSTDNGHNWTEITAGLPNKTFTRVAAHPTQVNTVAVSISGFNAGQKVYMSTDAGSTWTNISSNLPNIAANCLVWEECAENRLYVGMDAGVYYLENGNANWTLYADSLPLVEVTDLLIHAESQSLVAATWGRGAWKISLVDREASPRIHRIAIDPSPDFSRPNSLDSVYVKANVTDDIQVSSVQLAWGLDGLNYPNVISMIPVGVDTFSLSQAIPPQPTGTRVYFRITATDNQGNSTRSDKLMYGVKEAILCNASGSNGTGSDYINFVSLSPSGFNNMSGQEYYGDFRNAFYPVLQKGNSYSIGVRLQYSFPQDTQFAWIDWNRNLSFENNEQIIMSPFDASYSSTGNFTVPITAIEDTLTMRVRNVYGTFPINPDPCGNFFGEVEDYSLIIESAPVGRTEEEAFQISAWPIPANGTLYFSMPGLAEDWFLVDLSGKIFRPKEKSRQGNSILMDVSELPAGFYILQAEKGGIKGRTPVMISR